MGKSGASSKGFGVIVAIIGAFCYGITPTISKLGYAAGLNSFNLSFARYACGIFLMFLVMLATKQSFKVTKRQFVYIMIIAAICMVMILVNFTSYKYLSSGIALVLAQTGLVFIITMEIVLKQSQSKLYKWVGIVAIFIGVALIALDPTEGVEFSTFGLILALIGAFLGALQIFVFNSKTLAPLSVQQIFFYEMWLPAIGIPFIAKAFGYVPFPEGIVQWSYGFVVALLGLVIGLICSYTAIRILGPSTNGFFNALQPIFATIAGFVVFHDVISGRMILGSACIIGAVLAIRVYEASLAKKAQAAPAEE